MTGPQQGHAAMAAFSILVAGSFALGAEVANEISPLAFNVPRFWIAVCILGGLVWWSGIGTKAATAAPWRYLLLASLLVAYFTLMFEGLKTAPAVSAAAVFTLTPILAGGFGWILLRQVMTARMIVALVIGATGALWVIFRADLAALMRFQIGRGEAIYFIGCVCHAAYTPLIARLNRGETPLVFAFGTILAGAMLLTVVGWTDVRATDWTALRGMVWVTILYTAVFASSATFFLLQFATMRLPSAKVMAYTYLTPSWVILWQLAMGATAPPLLILVGVALTIVALLLLLKES